VSIFSISFLALVAASMNGGVLPLKARRSVDHLNAVAAAELFCTRDEDPVSLNIIAVGFHDHHEIPRSFQVEQHLRVAFAIAKEAMERVHGIWLRSVEWQPNA